MGEFISPEEYRKKTRDTYDSRDGKFLLKGADIEKLGPHMKTLALLKDSTDSEIIKEGGHKLSLMMEMMDDILPTIIIEPKVTKEQEEGALQVREIRFLDRVAILFRGIALCGLTDKDVKEVKDFQKHP